MALKNGEPNVIKKNKEREKNTKSLRNLLKKIEEVEY